ncbi:aspartic proteinase Asp1-like [Phoenix dactylifera]|uniref:Aspartic proteinase Asp1 n=1 Tax=Phoenix dactylifera TaxID=42345 RepID=A0A8B7BMS7_PHODC|nr:aspartic proteinase Asp1-like [Phoenix dactylifera]
MRMEGKGAALLVALLVVAAVLAAIPSCSAAATTTLPKKPKASAPPPSVDTGRRTPSSAVFRLRGNVYPNGAYYTTMNIGNPPKPYYMDVDTGSDITWLQCDAPCQRCSKVPHPLYKPPKSSLVPCENALCYAVHASIHQKHKCESPGQCDYEVQYADHGSSIGVLVADALDLPLINGSTLRSRIAFGCGYDQLFRNPEERMLTDGVLGLGFGKASILSQLSDSGVIHNVMGHCLSSRGGGYLFLGDGLVPPSGITWAPKIPFGDSNYYSPGPASLLLGTQSLGSKLQVVLDSGSSYTYFGFQPYRDFISAIKKDLSRQPLKDAPDDKSLPLCWKGPRSFRSVLDVKKYFKPLVLSFGNGRKATMEIPPENYLIVSKKGNACLGILNGTEAGLPHDLNVIGDISLQDLVVIYDNERRQIGWGQANCDRVPNADRIDGFCQPQFASMGILTEECPAYYHSDTV